MDGGINKQWIVPSLNKQYSPPPPILKATTQKGI